MLRQIHRGFLNPMSNGGRRYDAAFRRLKAGLGVILVVAALGIAAQSLHALYLRRSDLAATARKPCANPVNCTGKGSEADVRAANAAEDMVDLAVWQLVFGVLGIYFVARTLEATRDAVREANDATRAADDAIRVTEDTARKQLRAYLRVDIEKLEFGGPNFPTEVVLKVSNVGITPAYEVVTTSWVDVWPWPLPGDRTYTGPTGDGPLGKSIVYPAGAMRAKTGSAGGIPRDVLVGIADGTKIRFFVFGNTTYIDVYKVPHYTNFCYAVKGAPGEPLDIALCHEHNDAD